MKQSLWLVVLQIVSIVLGIVSTFYVAGSLPAEVYAVLGIYTVITSIMSVFSNTGLETFAGRNVLAWNAIGETEKTRMIVSQAIVMRTLVAIVLLIPAVAYSIFISNAKFDGMYLQLFIIMAVFSVVKVLNDSINLILKAFNKYLLASISNHSINVFGRLLALILFIQFGFDVYIGTIILLPLVVTIPLLFIIRKWISLKYVTDWRSILKNVRQTRYYTFSAYFRFGIRHLDLLLVTMLLTPEIIGTFTLVKRFETFANNFIANIFDPPMQKLVAYKNNLDVWWLRLTKIIRIQKFVFGFALFGLFVAYFVTGIIIEKMNLTHYPYLFYYILFMLLAETLLILLKIRFQLIMLFFSPYNNFKLSTLYSVFFVTSFFIMQHFNDQYLYLYAALANFLMLIFVFTYLFKLAKVESHLIKNVDN